MTKLGDFGLAEQLQHSSSRRGYLCGTSCYIAPEGYDGQTVRKSDVWSLGITLIELAEGKNPFAGYTALKVMRLVCDGDPPSLSGGKWSSEFVDFVSKCLVKDVNERWSVKLLMEARSCENE